MPETVLNAALIGCGGRGRGHIEAMKPFDDLRFVAVCDPVAELRDRVAAENEVPRRYDDIEFMLSKEELDLAFIATPAHLNGQCALPVIQAGVHTLLEKPPGLSGAETEGLRDAANASGAKVLVGWNRRFHSLIRKARGLIEERGPVTQIVAEFHKSMTGLHRRGFPDHLLDNFIYETPIHAIDLTRSLAGSAPIAELHAVARRTNSPFVDVYRCAHPLRERMRSPAHGQFHDGCPPGALRDPRQGLLGLPGRRQESRGPTRRAGRGFRRAGVRRHRRTGPFPGRLHQGRPPRGPSRGGSG